MKIIILAILAITLSGCALQPWTKVDQARLDKSRGYVQDSTCSFMATCYKVDWKDFTSVGQDY